MVGQADKKIRIANFVGTIGYAGCALQWFWTLALYVPLIIQLPMFRVQPATPPPMSVSSGGSFPSFLNVLILIGAGLLFLGLLYALFVKVPRGIAEVGEKVTHVPAEVLAPVIIQKVNFTKKQQKEVPGSIILAVKTMLVVVPFLAVLFTQGFNPSIPLVVSVFIGSIFMMWTALAFSLQYLLCKYFKIEYTRVR